MRRRELVRIASACAAASLGAPALVLARVLEPAAGRPAPTPLVTDGPYYPPAFDPAPSRTLVVGPLVAQAVPLRLAGRVVDRQGRPVAGARIEIWQCDANRRYHHPADGGAAPDRGFAGFGWQPTDAGGGYRFDTIRPVAYPGRTPHVHVKVKIDDRALLTSQIFMPDEATANERDFLWRQLDAASRPLALATLVPGAQVPVARFDIVLP
jgi:protocatechuate 3,4-dioxygenase beta subunit